MEYYVIGLMSGSSLDGLDIAFVRLEEKDGHWNYQWLATECIPYPEEWLSRLKQASQLGVPEFLRLHTAYGHYTGKVVQRFIERHARNYTVDFIAAHGHTVLHEPHHGVTCQIGDGASIAAETGIPVIADLRNMDVALGGQGAPIVPIGDRLLFGDFEYLLNLGGIANVTIRDQRIAFDICPCNQLLNYYAGKAGKEYDEGGAMAQTGTAISALVAQLSGEPFYQQVPPKSLANEFSTTVVLPRIDAAGLNIPDALATATSHIVGEIGKALKPFAAGHGKMLVTGGGALNTYLVAQLSSVLASMGIEVVIPEAQLVHYKEALVMALIGALRWRNEVNVLASVTGAKHDSIGGAIWAAKP